MSEITRERRLMGLPNDVTLPEGAAPRRLLPVFCNRTIVASLNPLAGSLCIPKFKDPRCRRKRPGPEEKSRRGLSPLFRAGARYVPAFLLSVSAEVFADPGDLIEGSAADDGRFVVRLPKGLPEGAAQRRRFRHRSPVTTRGLRA